MFGLFLAAVFLLLPLIFTQSFALSLMTQMGIAIIFALSYNMLLVRVGLLSFDMPCTTDWAHFYSAYS